MDYDAYWNKVWDVTYNTGENGGFDPENFWEPDEYAVYEDYPDALTGSSGIYIPVTEWSVDGEYEFEICLFGESPLVSMTELEVGWAFVDRDYGYTCDNNLALPDLCEASIYGAKVRGHERKLRPIDEPDSHHLLNIGHHPVMISHHTLSLVAMFILVANCLLVSLYCAVRRCGCGKSSYHAVATFSDAYGDTECTDVSDVDSEDEPLAKWVQEPSASEV
jgi:hypothetical protein